MTFRGSPQLTKRAYPTSISAEPAARPGCIEDGVH